MSTQSSQVEITNWPTVASYVSARKDTYYFIDTTKTNLTGKSILITGASKSIGKATAISFAKAGCSKILLAARSDLIDVEPAMKDAAMKAGRSQPLVLSLQMDVTSEDSVQSAMVKAAEVLDGRLDILINNAGNLEQWRPVAESRPSQWWTTWKVNIKGSYLCAHYFLPLLLKSETRTMNNFSSGGANAIFPGASGHQTAKFALCRLTEIIDKEYSKLGSITMAIHPAAVPTELAMNMPVHRQHVLTDTPELPADTLVWLCHPRKIGYLEDLCQLGYERIGKETPRYCGKEFVQISSNCIDPTAFQTCQERSLMNHLSSATLFT